MTVIPAVAHSGIARVCANRPVSNGLMRLDFELARPLPFQPGQFVMLNECGARALTFSRPFSIYAAGEDSLSLLYRVVGRGTAMLGALVPGATMQVLGPLGRAFPPPAVDVAAVLIAGGVGLPPLAAWLERWGRTGDHAYFGARDGGDVPWGLLGDRWQVSVERDEGVPPGIRVFKGVVTELVAADPDVRKDAAVYACGPESLLRAAAALAARRGWLCWLSIEEHMGCGYGVCKGCVVPVRTDNRDGWRNATCCQDGPVFEASQLGWGLATTNESADNGSIGGLQP